MDSRHELPPFLNSRNVQTSGLEAAILEKLSSQTEEFSISTVLSEWLKLDPSQVTYKLQTEVGNILRKHGCSRIERRNNRIRFWYIPPMAPYIHSDDETPQPDYQRRNKRTKGELLSTEHPLQVPGDPIKGAVCAIIILGVILFVLGFAYWVLNEKPSLPNMFALGSWSQQ